MNEFFKFCFDVLISFVALILFTPFIILISIIGVMFQGFPIFFIHERLGKNGIPFKMIKLRTMKNGPSLSSKNDEKRLTTWGKLLRNTSIDELPVFLNVLKRDMSVVGPRPMPTKYLPRFNKKQIVRLNVKPGITGLAQISGRNKISWEKRFELDAEYVRSNTFLKDLKILILTFYVVFRRKGIESEESEIMPEFLGEEKNSE